VYDLFKGFSTGSCSYMQPVRCGIGHMRRCGSALRVLYPDSRYFYQARAVGIYEGALKQMIQDFKFHGKIYLAEPFGRLMLHLFYDMYTQQTKEETIPALVMPVPLHAGRLRKRGFNQSFLMADRFIQLLGHHADPGSSLPRTDRTTLLRCRRTNPQTGLDKIHRKTNIAGAFRIDAPEKLSGKHVLLVDDVYTTGATVDECARILTHAGAARVDVLTLARA
jgi:ComF family protein